jgi:pimeloyl-ACP methyl ester carboxylesterase
VSSESSSVRVTGAGPLLIYLAGLDGTGELFYKQTPELARSYRVVTFRSREQGRFTYEDLTADVAALIQRLGEQRAILVGESFGGTVALQFALRYPAMVERLVVVNSFPCFRGRLRINLAARLAPVAPLRLTWAIRLAGNSLGLMVDGVRGEDRRRFFEIARSVEREAYARRLRLIAELDIEKRLSEIQAPTLFIAGERDWLVPSVREAHAMAARIRQATVKIIKGAGHACLLGNRVSLADILAQWAPVIRDQKSEIKQ